MVAFTDTPHNTAYRRNALWLAAIVHRISGILLACFLPLHFVVLGLAIENEAKLDRFLGFAEIPLVKIAEGLLVSLLTVHLLGGCRVLALEFFGRTSNQRRLVAISFGAAVLLGALYLIRML